MRPFTVSDPHALYSTLHGDARFGWAQHLWRAGMLATEQEWSHRSKRGYPIARACFSTGQVGIDGMVHWPHEGHRLIVGAPGSGKFTAAIAPLLLDDDGANAFFIDPKGGEATRWSLIDRNALSASKIGAEVLDSCGVFPGIRSQRLNTFGVLHPQKLSFVADADRLAEALAPDENLEDPFWVEAGRNIVRALILHAVTGMGRGGTRCSMYSIGLRQASTKRCL